MNAYAKQINDRRLVSVVMPAYNCGEHIKEAMRSVLGQTHADLELLVVDDCSMDATAELAEKIAREDRRVTVLRLPVNRGAAAARNVGLEAAAGRFIAFIDSDDVWYPRKLELQLEFMARSGARFVCAAYEQIDEHGKSIGRVIRPPKRIDYRRVLLDCPVGNSTVLYDAHALGIFSVPDIRKRNDDALWLKMLKVERYMYGMEEVLARYRVRSGSLSHNKFSLVKYHWMLYRDIEGLSLWCSVWHLGIWVAIKLFRLK